MVKIITNGQIAGNRNLEVGLNNTVIGSKLVLSHIRLKNLKKQYIETLSYIRLYNKRKLTFIEHML